MNLSNFTDKLLDFQHYEYIFLPLIIILFGIFALQQSGLIKLSFDDSFKRTPRPKKVKIIDLSLLLLGFSGFVISFTQNNLNVIKGEYLTIISTCLFFIKSFYIKIFDNEIKTINEQYTNEIIQNENLLERRRKNMIIYVGFIVFVIVITPFFLDRIMVLFSDSFSITALIFSIITLFTVGFFMVWNT